MKRIYRSRDESVIAGICGGIGELLDLDPVLVRLAAVFIAVVTGVVPAVVTYAVGWVIIPQRPFELPPVDVQPEDVSPE